MLLEVLLSFIVKVETLLYYSMLIFWTKLRQIGRLMVAMAWSVVHVMSSLLAMYGLWKWFRLLHALWFSNMIAFVGKGRICSHSLVSWIVNCAESSLFYELIWVWELWCVRFIIFSLGRQWLLSCCKRLEMRVTISTNSIINCGWCPGWAWHALIHNLLRHLLH